MNYASYDGKWDKLPDFDAAEAGCAGSPEPHRLGASERRYASLLEDHQEETAKIIGPAPLGLKATGYLKVKKAGDYAFSLQVDGP